MGKPLSDALEIGVDYKKELGLAFEVASVVASVELFEVASVLELEVESVVFEPFGSFVVALSFEVGAVIG